LNSTDCMQQNVDIISDLIAQGKKQGAEIIFFPENALFLRIREGDLIPFLTYDSEELNKLSQVAKENDITVNVGSVAMEIEGKRFNSNLMITNEGKVTVAYNKIHLFDIQLNGDLVIRESDVFHHGYSPRVSEFNSWKIGHNICFDIRFSRLANFYYEADVDLLIYPAAFLPKTGEAHWHVLNRSRAIEGQCYVISSAQGGQHISSIDKMKYRETYGHSMVVDPWGKVLVDCEELNSIVVLELTKEKINEVRRQIPVSQLKKEIN
ncbi:MAG: carbon-nitrogen hydrolase family protein, partial [Bdellovibrionaceae bacterium]|nr:carbon-nitrogen hydrolase family protein [Pseudobdellovibrionaceae bacterium]